MIESTADILRLTGAFFIFVVAVITLVLGIQMSQILRDVAKITRRVEFVTNRIEKYLTDPLGIILKKFSGLKAFKYILKLWKKHKKK